MMIVDWVHPTFVNHNRIYVRCILQNPRRNEVGCSCPSHWFRLQKAYLIRTYLLAVVSSPIICFIPVLNLCLFVHFISEVQETMELLRIL